MGVNSSFKGFFNSRLVVGSSFAMVMLTIFFITSSFTNRSDRDSRAKQTNIIIRQIGHRLLLQAGDLTSRVMPVTEIKEGTFLLEFENPFVFNHDSLMVLSQSLLTKTQFPSGYTVTVHECMKGEIVYGYQINNTTPDNLACKGRSQPTGCYTIQIAFPDLYENVEQQVADIDPLPKPKLIKVDPTEADPKPEELLSSKIVLQGVNSKSEELKTTTFDHPFINFYSGMLVLLGVTLLIGRFKKNVTPVPVRNQNHSVIKESVPKLAALGKFLFDVKGQRMLLDSEVISLTDKECRILELLNENFGELIPRETLMQKIWINEGVITGRSLDVFVSKLRKKLSSDPDLRITNVHGKGYMLEIPGIEIL